MSPAQRRYLAVEAAVSAGINAVLSIAFVLLVFRGQPLIPVDALVRDALAQSFMIALMASLVPTLLTRRRIDAGAIAPLSGVRARSHVLVLPLLTALVVASVAGALHWALLPRLMSGPAPFGSVLVAKAAYGGLLGAGVTLFAVRRALAAG